MQQQKELDQDETLFMHNPSLVSKAEKYLFTSDDNGFVKQFSISEHTLKHDWGHLHNGWITNIQSTNDYLFTKDVTGNLKQWSLKTRKLIRDWYWDVNHDRASAFCLSNNGLELFMCNYEGYLKQFSLEDQKIINDFGKIHNGEIHSLKTTSDDKFLFTYEPYGP